MNGFANGVSPSMEGVLPPRRRLWLFSMPRTASNLFVQMNKGHTNIANVEYEFMYGAFFKTLEKFDLGALSDEEKEGVRTIFDGAFNTVITKVEAAENEGKTIFAKEHSTMCLDRTLAYQKIYKPETELEIPNSKENAECDRWTLHMPGESEVRPRTNPSLLPDDFFLSWLPIFLIRHPALVVPSQYRVFKKAVSSNPLDHPSITLSTTFLWSRMMYDWYVENDVPAKRHGNEEDQELWPIILDADDIVRNNAIMAKFCRAAKLDPSELVYEWPSKNEEEIANAGLVGQFLSTLMGSSGIRKDLHGHDIDIDQEEQKWKEEFGEEIATRMRKLTEEAMPEYEYLRARRLQA